MEVGKFMICVKCNKDLTRCICDDIDERIESLKDSPYLAIDWERIKAQRLLNKFDIQRDLEAQGNQQP